MQLIKDIKPIIRSAKKNAPSATIAAIRFVTTIVIESNAIAIIIVPIIPASRQLIFLRRHFSRTFALSLAAIIRPQSGR